MGNGNGGKPRGTLGTEQDDQRHPLAKLGNNGQKKVKADQLEEEQPKLEHQYLLEPSEYLHPQQVLTPKKKKIANPTKRMSTNYKLINDPIHGHIELHPLLVRIIDTPQFQRLRHIKQMGAVYFVYPGACHSRFEHSIGVAHLAGELIAFLRKRQEYLDIDDRDELCVQIAGLCHDLGHGPFSHMFDHMFIKKERPELNWKHEKASVEMFDHMVEKNDLKEVMEQYGLDLLDLLFIKEQIAGPLSPSQNQDAWPYKGRPKSKSFLYDIVANNRNGVDVDKWDYFARDCYYLGIQNNFDYKRFLKFARVCDVDGTKHICTRDTEVHNLYDMFHTRHRIHQKACHHRVVMIIERMIAEAFTLADAHFKISAATNDMEAYTKLTDHVFDQILYSSDSEVPKAREILKKIQSRQHYRLVFEKRRPPSTVTKDQIYHSLKNLEEKDNSFRFKTEDFDIDEIGMDYGMEEENPINGMRFYSKDNPDHAKSITEDQVSAILPTTFSETLVRVYSKKTDEESLRLAKSYFSEYNPNK